MRIRLAVGTVAASVLIVLGFATATVDTSHKPTTTPTIQPCPEEDSVNCFWDASTRGNGKGRSFFVNADGQRYYVDDMRAECEAGAQHVCDSLALNLP